MASPQSMVHPELKAHADAMHREIYTIKDHIHTAYAYAPSNTTLIEGDQGLILVDTLPSVDVAEPVAAAFRAVSDKPIKAVIYTHVHPDHISGVRAFIDEEQVRSGEVEIIALDDLVPALVRDNGMLAPILSRRAMYTFGFQLPLGAEGNISAGLGVAHVPGRRTFIAPTRTFARELKTTICGVDLELYHLPSETEDHVVVWLPNDKVLISADVIQGKTFPNIYALRGTSFRNPMIWVDAIDRLRRFHPETLIPHHGHPVQGSSRIEDLLIAYRDAIQYLHDQTVRRMNKGFTPEEIVEEVRMPPHLACHEWLGEFYGSYKHSIPAIYDGYIGWFDGDPIHLDPAPRRERAHRYVSLMGGRDRIMASARDALAHDDPQWAAEMVTWLLKCDVDDEDARALKAEAIRRWGYAQKNTNWRNWALTTALELERELAPPRGMAYGGPDSIRNFPARALINLMTTRLKAEKAMETRATLAFCINDHDENCALEIRRGVCQFHPESVEDPDILVTLERGVLDTIFLQQTSFPEAIKGGKIAVHGDVDRLCAFLDLFEEPSTDMPIAVR